MSLDWKVTIQGHRLTLEQSVVLNDRELAVLQAIADAAACSPAEWARWYLGTLDPNAPLDIDELLSKLGETDVLLADSIMSAIFDEWEWTGAKTEQAFLLEVEKWAEPGPHSLPEWSIETVMTVARFALAGDGRSARAAVAHWEDSGWLSDEPTPNRSNGE